MVDVALSAGRLLVALFLVFLNGFFVASEFAFVRVRATAVEQLVEEGRPGSATLSEVMGNLDSYLAVTQLGITIASLGLGWAGEPAVASLIEPVLGSILPASLLHLVAFAIAFTLVTFLHVVFGELAPKTIAISQPDRVSLVAAPPMKFFYLLFYPGIVVFNGTANAVTRMLGFPPASESDETLGERELRRVLAQSGEEGHVDAAEVRMIERVFELDDTTVREVMVPRPDVVALPTDASLAEVRSTVLESGHTRYPVVAADDPNEVVGYLDVKDVLRADAAGDEPEGGAGDGTAGESATAGDLAREIVVVPETTAADDLLLQFREERRQMAAVIDEWGAFEGIVTVEDLVESVVGDLRDGFDPAGSEPAIRRRGEGDHSVDGGVPIARVNDVLGVDLAVEGVETMAGVVLDRLDRAPEEGDRVEVDGLAVEVTAVDGTRIRTVRVREGDGTASGDGESTASDDESSASETDPSASGDDATGSDGGSTDPDDGTDGSDRTDRD